VLTAVVAIPIVLGVNYVGGWPFALVIDIATVVAAAECCRLIGVTEVPALFAGVAGAAVISTLPLAVTHPQGAWIGVLLLVIGVSGVWSLSKPPGSVDIGKWSLAIVPALYVGIPLGMLHLLRHAPRGAWWVFAVLLVTWAYDTGAFAAGSAYGRHPFMQHVSARKTREGVAGGLLLSGLAGLIAIPALGLLYWQAIAIGLAGGAVAQIGDLVESMMKRQAGVKDSGTIVPGHGGLMDRVDGLLWTAALGYFAAVILGHAP